MTPKRTLVKDSGYDEVVRLFIKESVLYDDRRERGVLLPPMSLYEERDIMYINQNDCRLQLEDDINPLANEMGWVIRIETHPVGGGTKKRYDYKCFFVSLQGMLQDELIDVIRYC